MWIPKCFLNVGFRGLHGFEPHVFSKASGSKSLCILKLLGDQLRSVLKSGVGVIGAVLDGKPSIAFVVTDDLVKTGIKATDFIKKIGKELGGGGGGKPHFATAGGKDSKRLDGALKAAKKLITANL